MKIIACSLWTQFHNSSLWILLSSSIKCWIVQDEHYVTAYKCLLVTDNQEAAWSPAL